MSDDELVRRLRDALHQEAEAVQPSAEGLTRIRAAIEGGPGRDAAVVPLRGLAGAAGRSRRRQWIVVAAAAATVLAITATGTVLLRPGDPVIAVEVPAGVVQENLPRSAVEPLPVYFVERQGSRWALIREFEPTTLTEPEQRLQAAVQLAVAGAAVDPDYTSVWRRLGLSGRVTVSRAKDRLTVVLPPSLLPAPSGTTDTDDLATLARLAVDQLVWTATATTGASLPVVVRAAAPDQSLLGRLALDGPFHRGDGGDDPRAPVSISTLTHGQSLRVGRATISGEATAPVTGGVTWTLLHLDTAGEPTPAPGQFPLLGSPGGPVGTATPTLADGSAARPGQRGTWKIHVTLPEPGEYTLVVRQAGSDWQETKTFTVR